MTIYREVALQPEPVAAAATRALGQLTPAEWHYSCSQPLLTAGALLTSMFTTLGQCQ